MAWAFIYTIGFRDDMEKIRAHDRVRIIDEIEGRLAHQPLVEVRGRKDLHIAAEDGRPIWQLTVMPYRVHYVASDGIVTVRHVEYKGRKTTKEIL